MDHSFTLAQSAPPAWRIPFGGAFLGAFPQFMLLRLTENRVDALFLELACLDGMVDWRNFQNKMRFS